MADRHYKVDEPIEIIYQAPNKQTGLTIEAEIILPGNVKDSNYPDLILTEVLGKGVYRGDFTPDTQGEWKVVVHDDTGDGQVVKRYPVGGHDVHSVGEKLNDIDTSIDDVDIQLDSVETKIDSISTQVGSLDTPPMIS